MRTKFLVIGVLASALVIAGSGTASTHAAHLLTVAPSSPSIPATPTRKAPWSGYVRFETRGSGSTSGYGWTEHDFADFEIANGISLLTGAGISYREVDTPPNIDPACNQGSFTVDVNAPDLTPNDDPARFGVQGKFVSYFGGYTPQVSGTQTSTRVCDGETTTWQAPWSSGYLSSGAFVLPRGPNSGGVYQGSVTVDGNRSNKVAIQGCYAAEQATGQPQPVGTCTLRITWFFYKPKVKITKLDLRDIDNKDLKYLSVAGNYNTNQGSIFDGNTRVNGTIKIHGPKHYVLKKLVLDAANTVGFPPTAYAHLAPAAAAKLIGKPFGADETLSITTPQLLFELPAAEAQKINLTIDNKVALTVYAEAENGQQASRDWGSVPRLTRYLGANRFGTRDLGDGGDDWLLPSLISIVTHFAPGHCYNDASNMNGGPFIGHKSHANGYDIDVRFASSSSCTGAGINYHSAADAQKILNDLNDPTFGSAIRVIFAKFSYSVNNPFWTTIRDAPPLVDGRLACRVIVWDAAHGDHLHWRFLHDVQKPGWCPGDAGPPPQP